MLSPFEQQQYAEYKKNTNGKFLEMIVTEAINKSLKSFVSEIQAANQEVTLYTIEEVRDMFKVTRQTINNWRKRGWIVGQRIGKNRYFNREEIDQALRLNQIGTRY